MQTVEFVTYSCGTSGLTSSVLTLSTLSPADDSLGCPGSVCKKRLFKILQEHQRTMKSTMPHYTIDYNRNKDNSFYKTTIIRSIILLHCSRVFGQKNKRVTSEKMRAKHHKKIILPKQTNQRQIEELKK